MVGIGPERLKMVSISISGFKSAGRAELCARVDYGPLP
jgi:hypothetical protein